MVGSIRNTLLISIMLTIHIWLLWAEKEISWKARLGYTEHCCYPFQSLYHMKDLISILFFDNLNSHTFLPTVKLNWFSPTSFQLIPFVWTLYVNIMMVGIWQWSCFNFIFSAKKYKFLEKVIVVTRDFNYTCILILLIIWY
jgi:hypothetical protein